MQLIDDLEATVERGKHIPAFGTVIIDRHVALDLIDRLRRSIPMELEQARSIIQRRQEIILSAQEEATRIVDAAKEEADYLVGDTGVMAEARQRGEAFLRQADENARRTQQGVDRYALNVLGDVEDLLRGKLADLAEARAILEHPRES